MRYLIIILVTILSSCQNTHQSKQPENQAESWMSNNFIDSVQILLTNHYELNNSNGYGASSFLVKSKSDTLLCTAKHLLGEAMGITPEVRTDSFNSVLQYWNAYPRNNKVSSDTVKVDRLINEEVNSKDIILLSLTLPRKHKIQPLTPRYNKVSVGEHLFVIGCEYSDYDCHQHKYSAIMDSYEEGLILIKSLTKFSLSGFSGAPVIDEKGCIIGVLSGGGEFEEELYLLLEPITSVQEWLEK